MTKTIAILLLTLLAGCAEPALSSLSDSDSGVDGSLSTEDVAQTGGVLIVYEWTWALGLESRCAGLGGHVPSRLELGVVCETPFGYSGVSHCLTTEGMADSLGGFTTDINPQAQVRVICWVD